MRDAHSETSVQLKVPSSAMCTAECSCRCGAKHLTRYQLLQLEEHGFLFCPKFSVTLVHFGGTTFPTLHPQTDPPLGRDCPSRCKRPRGILFAGPLYPSACHFHGQWYSFTVEKYRVHVRRRCTRTYHWPHFQNILAEAVAGCMCPLARIRDSTEPGFREEHTSTQ